MESIIYLYQYKLLDIYFILWLIIQSHDYLFCCSSCSSVGHWGPLERSGLSAALLAFLSVPDNTFQFSFLLVSSFLGPLTLISVLLWVFFFPENFVLGLSGLTVLNQGIHFLCRCSALMPDSCSSQSQRPHSFLHLVGYINV